MRDGLEDNRGIVYGLDEEEVGYLQLVHCLCTPTCNRESQEHDITSHK